MLKLTKHFTILVVLKLSVARSTMDINNQTCSEDCGRYILPKAHRSQQYSHVDVSGDSFLGHYFLTFPCPAPWWPFCTDFIFKRRININLSCQDITKIIRICLEQTSEDFYSIILLDCKQYLKCQKFKSLCSSGKFSPYCVDSDGTKNSVPPITVEEDHNVYTPNKHMNNTTEFTMTKAGASPGDGIEEPINWNVLWFLLVMFYILVFVPCFLNFVIKRSIIDRLRNRWQQRRSPSAKQNCTEEEPPLIPAIEKDVSTPVGAENALYIPSRPDSMASSIGEDFDFPYADESAAVSMVSLLIDEEPR